MYNSIGHYRIKFNGSIGIVKATVDWTYKYYDSFGSGEDDEGPDLYESNFERYDFTYSLETFEYLSGHDQDEFDARMQAWFHTYLDENTKPGDTFWILGQEYQFSGTGIFWDELVSYEGKKMVSRGKFTRGRGDPYGTFNAESTAVFIYNDDGWFIGEDYHETDIGYGIWRDSTFTKKETMRVIAATYDVPISYPPMYLLFGLPFLVYLVIAFPVYGRIRWKSRQVYNEHGIITIMEGIPNKPINIESQYSAMIPEYLHRASVFNERIISAVLNDEIVCIGILDKQSHVGSFFGKHNQDLIKFGKPHVFFSESLVKGYTKIEEYQILKKDNLSSVDVTYDSNMIIPMRPEYINPIKKIVAIEDNGTDNIKDAKWVDKSRISDLIYVAKVPVTSPWVQEILSSQLVKKHIRPDIINGEVIVGCAFCTPSQKTGWLYGLYVHPAFRNRGIGRQLGDARLSALRIWSCGDHRDGALECQLRKFMTG